MKDIDAKINKTQHDKSSLEEKKSDNSNKMMGPEKYQNIQNMTTKVINMIIPAKNLQ